MSDIWDTNVLSLEEIEQVLTDFHGLWGHWETLSKAIVRITNTAGGTRWGLAGELEQLVREIIGHVIGEVIHAATLSPFNLPDVGDDLTDTARVSCSNLGAHVGQVLVWARSLANHILDAVIENRHDYAAQTQALVTLGYDDNVVKPPKLTEGYRNVLNGKELNTPYRRRFWVLYELLAHMVLELDALCAALVQVINQATAQIA